VPASDEIVDQAVLDRAVAVINPPADSIETCRNRVDFCIRDLLICVWMFEHRLTTSPAEWRDRIVEYAKQLRKTKKLAAAMYSIEVTGFIASLDTHIRDVEGTLARVKVGRGGKARDEVAEWCAEMAHHLLMHDNPRWRQKATLTPDGAWLQLSKLLYEGVTGEYDSDHMSKYCRECRRDPLRFWQDSDPGPQHRATLWPDIFATRDKIFGRR